MTRLRLAFAIDDAIQRGEIIRVSATKVGQIRFWNQTLRALCRDGRFLVWPNGRLRRFPGRAALAAVKGAIEHGDAAFYFGSTLALDAHVHDAAEAGMLAEDGSPTPYGEAFHHRHLRAFPPPPVGSRHAHWPWSDLVFPDEADPAAVATEIEFMLEAGREIARLSALIGADIQGRIRGEAGRAFFAMLEENRRAWRDLTSRRRPLQPDQAWQVLAEIAARADALHTQYRTEVEGDGASKFDALLSVIRRETGRALSPALLALPAPPQPAPETVTAG